MFDITKDNSRHPVRLWVARRPKTALGALVGVLALGLVLVLANTHHAGVTMITPGKKTVSLNQAGADDRQALLAQASAATRQADANG